MGVGARYSGEGTYVHLWLIHNVWQRPTQIVKQLFPIRNFKKGGSDFNLCVQCLLCIVYKRNETQAILLFRF